MTITMQNIERLTLAEMEEFLEGSRSLGRRLNRRWKGVVRLFLMKVTGQSRAQLTRLVTRWMRTRKVERKPARRPHFTTRYTSAGVALLAAVDAANDDISGPGVYHDKPHSTFCPPSDSFSQNRSTSSWV
jgi:hypothetical protein